MSRLAKKYAETNSVNHRGHNVHKKSFSDREFRILKKIVSKNPKFTSTEIRRELQDNMDPVPSASTIRRYLFNNGIRAYTAKRKPLLTSSMIKKRIAWCKTHKDMPDNYWEKVIFSDECRIDMFNFRGRQMVRRRSFENPFQFRYLKASVKQSPAVMIWGCFSANGTGRLEIIDGVLNSEGYLKILEDKMLPSVNLLGMDSDFIFQDDSAPIHRAKKVKSWKNSNNIEQLSWPGNSPDLNPIENLWKIVKNKVALKNPKTVLQLKKAIILVWRTEIPKDLYKSIVLLKGFQ